MFEIYKKIEIKDKKYLSISGFGRPFSINFYKNFFYITDMDLNAIFKISKNWDYFSVIYDKNGWSQKFDIN